MSDEAKVNAPPLPADTGRGGGDGLIRLSGDDSSTLLEPLLGGASSDRVRATTLST